MRLALIVALLRLLAVFVNWLERQRLKAEGKAEAYAEAKKVHDERVAKANDARADTDAADGVPDPFDRDNAGRG